MHRVILSHLMNTQALLSFLFVAKTVSRTAKKFKAVRINRVNLGEGKLGGRGQLGWS